MLWVKKGLGEAWKWSPLLATLAHAVVPIWQAPSQGRETRKQRRQEARSRGASRQSTNPLPGHIPERKGEGLNLLENNHIC